MRPREIYELVSDTSVCRVLGCTCQIVRTRNMCRRCGLNEPAECQEEYKSVYWYYRANDISRDEWIFDLIEFFGLEQEFKKVSVTVWKALGYIFCGLMLVCSLTPLLFLDDNFRFFPLLFIVPLFLAALLSVRIEAAVKRQVMDYLN